MSSIKESFDEGKKKISEEIGETKEQIGKTLSKGVSKTKKFFRKLFLSLFAIAIVGGGLFLLYSNWTYSEGTRTGYLIKISQKGYIFKTYEGQLNLGGFQSEEGPAVMGGTWSFSLKDDALYRKMETMEGKKVTLRYKEINKSMPWQGDTNYFITDISDSD